MDDGDAPRHRAGRGWRSCRCACERSRGEARRAEGARPGRSAGSAVAKSAAMQSGQPRGARGVRAGASWPRPRALLSGATAVLVCWEEAPRHGAPGRRARPRRLVRRARLGRRTRAWPWWWGPKGGLPRAEVERASRPATRARRLVTLGPVHPAHRDRRRRGSGPRPATSCAWRTPRRRGEGAAPGMQLRRGQPGLQGEPRGVGRRRGAPAAAGGRSRAEAEAPTSSW